MKSPLVLSLAVLLGLVPTCQPLAAPYEAVDTLGRSLSFEGVPQRVLVVGRATLLLLDAVYLFPGARSRVIGIGETDQGLGDSLPLLEPGFRAKARFANSVGPEELAAARPDLVILKTSMKSKLGDTLERVGIPVFYLDLESPESFRRDIRSLGELFQDPGRAIEVERWYDERLAAVSREVAGAPRPRVLLVQSSGRDAGLSYSIPPAGWIQSWMTAAAGGEPVWLEANSGGGWLKIGIEQAASWRPQVVLVVSYQEPAAAAADRLRASGTLASTIRPFPADFISWDQSDPRWILGLEWMAATLHPDRAAGFSLQEEATRYYADLYGLEPAVIREQVLPRVARSLGTP